MHRERNKDNLSGKIEGSSFFVWHCGFEWRIGPLIRIHRFEISSARRPSPLTKKLRKRYNLEFVACIS